MKTYTPYEIFCLFADATRYQLSVKFMKQRRDVVNVSCSFENSKTDLIEFEDLKPHETQLHGFGDTFENAVVDYFNQLGGRVLFIGDKKYYFRVVGNLCVITSTDDLFGSRKYLMRA